MTDASGGSASAGESVTVGDFARLDLDRRARTGVPEVVFGQGKSAEQIVRLLEELRRRDPAAPALATRCSADTLAAARDRFPAPDLRVDELARTVLVGPLLPPVGSVLVLTAGTSDLPVARECVVSLQALGVGADLLADVGVAGLHRLLEQLPRVRRADAVVVVAGMDGALPSVVSGLVRAPVIGVPTSVGYGVAAGGIAATLAMLASCSPGLAVVNVDNGFGAAAHAAKILRVSGRG